VREPFFSIVIPTFQRRETVCAAVTALAGLRYRGKFEVVVVVDGSTDGTAAALRGLSFPFPLHIVEQPNRGQASARNRGASEASGEIILFLDDDMIAQPDLLEQHARSQEEGADAVTGEIWVDPGSPPGFVTDALARAAEWERKPPLTGFDVYSGHMSIAKTVFDEVGGFDESLLAEGYGTEDLDFGLRLVAGHDVRHNKAAVAWQTSLVGPREHMRRARKLAKADVRAIAKHPDIISRLLECRGAPRPGESSLTLKLSRLPLLPEIAAAIATASAELAPRLGLGSNRALARIYFGARSMAYWSALRRAGGATRLREWLGQ
jgi:glycosyltransferase involved in cell wall biosynthesis